MYLKSLELAGFKSFGKKTDFSFESKVTAIVGPNGSGKSNVAEGFRWVLGEQSLKSLRGKRGEDLIFNGGTGNARQNRAKVTVVFDNKDRSFNLDFDEVILSREVHRDGENVYSINGSAVRLKDVLELLGSVSLGSTGHHIISQGEADRILNANINERREMVEEALGLKLYQWKISESEKKLEKTTENIKQVESLRRELAPHLKFLDKQVEKINKADELRRELKNLYQDYLSQEKVWLIKEAAKLKNSEAELLDKQQMAQTVLVTAEEKLQSLGSQEQAFVGKLREVENRRLAVRSEKSELARSLGRLEGLVEIRAAELKRLQNEEAGPVPFREVESLVNELAIDIEHSSHTTDTAVLISTLARVKARLQDFVSAHHGGAKAEHDASELAKLEAERAELEARANELANQEREIETEYNKLREEMIAESASSREYERAVYEAREKLKEVEQGLSLNHLEVDRLKAREQALMQEVSEGAVLVDHEIKTFIYEEKLEGVVAPEDWLITCEPIKKNLERMKIRLEDMGGGGADVLEEYKQAKARDEFLVKELNDLAASEVSLRQVIAELTEKLVIEFTDGVKKINNEFGNFFKLMFGGGSAELSLVKPVKRKKKSDLDLDFNESDMAQMQDEADEGVREGIEISVNLPKKKIKGLEMLSGGERALTSIALLFAMSQVNPPPFLILDETDAALDESNSRRYGDMVAQLSEKSQLIVITHNRETMSRAGILYGVTMGADGMSRLLSIKLDDAAQWAK